jgi:transcriptional regulator with XRE-family HTH domain
VLVKVLLQLGHKLARECHRAPAGVRLRRSERSDGASSVTLSATIGERVADYRRKRGLSQRDLAAAMNRSESWVSQVERGVQPVERLSVLQALAQALSVSVRDLRPEAVPEPEEPPPATDLDGLRLELSGHPALARLFAPSDTPSSRVDLRDLTDAVSLAWTLAHESRYAELDRTLPDLLPRLELAVRDAETDDDRAALHVLRARAYQAAAAAFSRQDEPDAAWLAADRAITAAELSGHPLDVIAGHFRLAHAFIRLRRFDQADRVATNALDALEPLAEDKSASPELLSLYGAMHLVRAVICGHESNRSQAHRHLDQAERIGRRLGTDRNDFDTEFGPTNVQLHRVAVAVDLGDAGEALDVADRIDASGLSPERQACLLVDVARAHAQRRHVGEATAALLDAERLAPEQVRSHHLAHATITDLLAQSGRRPPAELADLARRSGAE